MSVSLSMGTFGSISLQQSAVLKMLLVILRKCLAHTHTHTVIHSPISSLSTCSNVLTDIILERFRFVKVIRGQLQISLWNRSTYPSLPSVINYFRNVEYIGSLNLTLDTINTNGDALVISTNPGLERVDLSRLRSVRYGNVRVRSNPDLCYVGDFQTTMGSNSVYLTETELILPAGTNVRTVEDCSESISQTLQATYIVSLY